MTSSLPLPMSTMPLLRGMRQRQDSILRAKRRVYHTGLILIGLSTLFLTVLLMTGKTNYPSYWAYMATNLGIIGLCAGSLWAMRRLENVRKVEQVLTWASLGYLFYWDFAALLTHYLPRAEFLMTSAANFILTAALVCLVTPRKTLLRTLLTLFGAHELLTWVNLLQFPWGRTQNAELMTDVMLFVTMLCLSLIGLYQTMATASHEEAQMMQLMANTDPLTELANRRAMYAHLESAPSAAILLIDVDDFKKVNDSFGHDVGDGVLVNVAQNIQDIVGLRGQVGRWGGEEFIVLLPNTAPAEALRVAENIRSRIEQTTSSLRPVTLSIGVSMRQPGEALNLALKRADELLYQAKSQGKNQVASK